MIVLAPIEAMPKGFGRKLPGSKGKSDARYKTAAIRHALSVTLLFLLSAVLYVCLADDLFPVVPEEIDGQIIINASRFMVFAMATAVMIFLAAWWMSRQWVEAQRKLDQSEKELVMRLGQAAEWRDDETGDHTLRVLDSGRDGFFEKDMRTRLHRLGGILGMRVGPGIDRYRIGAKLGEGAVEIVVKRIVP